ncbi:hypothetical protein N665_0706s0009 [Sinapis alba]|nr:hypothetical protein N665_0706s0009 [Sinapis alba]
MFASESFGDWGPIRDVKDPHKYVLKFMNVVRGEFQIVSGINYRVVVEDNDGSNSAGKMYEAVVLDQLWMKTMNLTSFTPVLKNRFL